MTSSPYDPHAYWQDLLGESSTLRSVGYAYLPESFNEILYRAMTAAVRGAIRRTGVEIAGRSVCDIGCGSGAWVELWHRLGAARVAGVDLVPEAIARLAERYPADDLRQGDVTAETPPFAETFHVVSAMSVLLHVKDEKRFERAIRNIAAMIEPGGTLLVMDPVVTRRRWEFAVTERSNSRARPLERWRQVLGREGLELLELSPVTALLANPADTRSKLGYWALDKYWTALVLTISGRERLGRLAGQILYLLDRPLTRNRRGGPSTKVLVARRRARS
jgi:SAM-dependent methyltransferase